MSQTNFGCSFAAFGDWIKAKIMKYLVMICLVLSILFQIVHEPEEPGRAVRGR